MNTGFETIGNASLIIYDGGKPILSTDPWIDGYPYFGSWKQSYKIPNKQKNNMVNSKYIWISHGHPDHLDIDTIKNFKENKFLLANHYGDRIINDFNNLGLNTKKLIDKKWYNISKNIKIATYADFFQNSVLLIIIKDVLIINLNDCNNGAWKSWVKSVSKQFNKVFLLKLVGYGDADMINYYDEDDNFIYPLAEKKIPVGKSINKLLNSYQANFFIPFSSHHKYQRDDSIWAKKYLTTLDDYKNGFEKGVGDLLPAYISYDVLNDSFKKINVEETNDEIISSKKFNDDWCEELSITDKKLVENYFKNNELLSSELGFINFIVGKKSFTIDINKKKYDKGIIFEVPRFSLIQSITFNIFDDLLIGNFMKTKVLGFGGKQLYPIFNPIIPKYYDQAKIKTKNELKEYYKFYFNKNKINFIFEILKYQTSMVIRKNISTNNKLYQNIGKLRKIGLKDFF